MKDPIQSINLLLLNNLNVKIDIVVDVQTTFLIQNSNKILFKLWL